MPTHQLSLDTSVNWTIGDGGFYRDDTYVYVSSVSGNGFGQIDRLLASDLSHHDSLELVDATGVAAIYADGTHGFMYAVDKAAASGTRIIKIDYAAFTVVGHGDTAISGGYRAAIDETNQIMYIGRERTTNGNPAVSKFDLATMTEVSILELDATIATDCDYVGALLYNAPKNYLIAACSNTTETTWVAKIDLSTFTQSAAAQIDTSGTTDSGGNPYQWNIQAGVLDPNNEMAYFVPNGTVCPVVKWNAKDMAQWSVLTTINDASFANFASEMAIDLQHGYLYVGRGFGSTSADGNIVKVDLRNFSVTQQFAPGTSGTGIKAFAPDPYRDVLYASDGTNVLKIATNDADAPVSALTVAPSTCPWTPSTTPRQGTPSADWTVNTFLLADEGLYVAGGFTSIGAESRSGLALLDPTDATVRAWDAKLSNAAVYALAIDDQWVYVGGSFTQVDGETRKKICRVSRRDGSLDWSWVPNEDGWGGSWSDVQGLAVTDDRVYVSGQGLIDSWDSYYAISALDKATCEWIASFGPIRSCCPQGTDAIADATSVWSVDSGGGNDTVVKYVAADGTKDANFSFTTDGYCYRMLDAGDGNLYVCGQFTSVTTGGGNDARDHICKVDKITGTLQSWAPNLGLAEFDEVKRMWIDPDCPSRMFWVGRSQNDGAIAGVIDIDAETSSSWTIGGGNYAHTIVTAANVVFVGGDFGTVTGGSMTYLALYDPISGGVGGLADYLGSLLDASFGIADSIA